MACFVSFFNQLNDTEYHLSGFLILPDCCIAFCVSLIDAIIIRVIKLFHLLHIMLFCVNASDCYDISNLANARASEDPISTLVLITS